MNERAAEPALNVDRADLADYFAERNPVYRYRRPVYLVEMISSLAAVWTSRRARVLDVGGGTGLIAQSVFDHFGVASVQSVDIVDRYAPDLTIARTRYDGEHLPFADGSFDCGMIMNVIHHVPEPNRVALLAEIRRAVGHGPVYIKDHLSAGLLDDTRLTILDAIGNIPFGGMVKARYLRGGHWSDLAAGAGYRIAKVRTGNYRAGPMAVAFPNRLEIVMRLEAVL
ncbi:MAG: class I SAM-dependent methyltransferase [Methylocystis sp.]|nr:class I SAM-dependent methyltransferase [Methylocystis sp.]MCA3587495.1 class I SAM-dependent methyltransferase [Methylocystis sp.]MCA3591014.1 class I SAM-dependent methyltransferase [Methylocystis sp.]